jgi:N-acetylornithine carbamoyltransferase
MRDDGRIEHLIRLRDLSHAQLDDLLELSLAIKRGATPPGLPGRSVGLLFFRGSLRTRTSFEAAMHQLGGQVVHLNASDFWDLEAQEGTVMDGRAPEHIKDAAHVLSRYVDALAIRPDVPGHSWAADRRDAQIQAWASYARVPVINMESALWHPLQGLADLMTLREALGELAGRRLAIVWTRSPTPASAAVVHTLLVSAAAAGMRVALAHPPGYGLDQQVLREAAEEARASGAEVQTGLSQQEAVEGAHIVYARSWQSLDDYGNPTLAASRRARSAGWIVDEALMALGEDARLMHAMPVRRNLEVTDEVLDGPRSLIVHQAENRLHSQKALLLHMLRG